MTLATEVKKLAESKPFYAVAGAGDFAVEKLRELPEQIQKLQGRREEFREAAKDLPEKAREFAGKAEGYAKDFSGKAVSKASGEAALELEEVSEAAEPAVATQATRKSTRTPKTGSAPKA